MKPESAKPEEKPSAPAEVKPEQKKPAPSEVKPESTPFAPEEEKPEEKKPESAPPAEKKPDHHATAQFEFKKPMLVVNYPKFQNTSFTVGQVPLKAPESHPIPEPEKPAPPKSFKAQKKLHLEVKIATAKEPGAAPMISLELPAKPEKTIAVPARRKASRKAAAPKDFRPAKPLKLRVRVSPAVQSVAAAPEKRKPRKGGSHSAKKGK